MRMEARLRADLQPLPVRSALTARPMRQMVRGISCDPTVSCEASLETLGVGAHGPDHAVVPLVVPLHPGPCLRPLAPGMQALR